MRAALVCAAVLAASVWSAAGLNAAPVALPGLAKWGGEEAMSCGECELVVGLAQTITKNSTLLSDVIKVLDSECAKMYPSDPSKVAVCDAVAKGLADVLPWALKQLDTLDWDIPVAVCSVFIPVCKQKCCAESTAPEQLHLSLVNQADDMTADTSRMAITWVTLDATATSTVQWGPAGGAMSNSATGSTRTYTSGGWVGVIHAAVMTGLTPGQRYTYRVGDAAGGWSSPFTFRAMNNNLGMPGQPLRVAQTGDMGFGPVSDTTVATLTSLASSGAIDVMLHVGDVGYADGDESHWDVFMRKVEPIAARVPYMVTPGNHELWFNFTAYKERFTMPTPRTAPADAMFYGTTLGRLQLFMTNTETWFDTPNLSPLQRDWLDAHMRRGEPLARVVAGHRPLYCSNHGNSIQCAAFAKYLRGLVEDTYKEARVDLVIQAHEHDMEMSYPVYQESVVQTNYTSPRAPVYVVSGAGGNREGNALPASDQPWVAFASRQIGYGLMTLSSTAAAQGALHVSLQWDFVAANGTAIHSATITKEVTSSGSTTGPN